MISEGSCDWSNEITGINYILKYILIENCQGEGMRQGLSTAENGLFINKK